MAQEKRNTEKHAVAPEGRVPTRRRFFTRLWAVLGGLAFVELVVVGAVFLRRRKPAHSEGGGQAIISCGAADLYSPGTVTAFVRGRFYLSRLDDGGFLAVSRRCTHLGCTVPWEEEAKRFVCPCHASAFDMTGQVINAPAPRALDIYPLTIENNIITVDTHDPIRRSSFKKEQVVYPKTS